MKAKIGVKKKFKHIKWITDFRDPWSKLDLLDDFHLSKGSKSKHIQLEKQVLENSDLVLTVSEKWAADFKNLGSSLNSSLPILSHNIGQKLSLLHIRYIHPSLVLYN